ncbi:hypothetical protein MRBLPD1_002346 [Pseudomonas brassicacearum]|uniref:hypothetical protein n=1 Tax=Pseudomonas brassicacearum TaxID=930166 RepID=UPI003467D513
MKSFEDFTDFKEGNWNGWKNGTGIRPAGELKTEKGTNTFWSGKLERSRDHYLGLQPSLFKEFNFQDDEERKAQYHVTFDYRLHPLGPGEAKMIAITVTTETTRQLFNNWTEPDAELNKWHSVRWGFIGMLFADGSKQIWIGTRGGSDFETFRKVDIDNIRVRRISLQYE